MRYANISSLLIRIGLAAVFFYASIAALLDPFSWVGFFPTFLRNIIPDKILLYSHSIAELVLAFWLLSGWKTFYAALLSALSMAAIVIFNFGALDIVFRDIGLFFAALALVTLTRIRE